MNRSVFGDGEGVVSAPPSHSHGLSSLHPIPDEGADDQRGKRQQPDIPTCPERRVVHDPSSTVSGGRIEQALYRRSLLRWIARRTIKYSCFQIDRGAMGSCSLLQSAPGKFCRRINLTIRDAIPTVARCEIGPHQVASIFPRLSIVPVRGRSDQADASGAWTD